MHERVPIRHARNHQPLKAVAVPSVELVAEPVQITLQELYIDAVENVEQLTLGVAYHDMNPRQDFPHLAGDSLAMSFVDAGAVSILGFCFYRWQGV